MAAIDEALSALQAHLPAIAKTSTVEVAKGVKTNYADLATVSEAILPVLAQHGLSFVSAPTLLGDRFVLRCELRHTSGDKIEAIYPLSGNGHHQIGSAITYGRRYCLGAMTGLTPEDDDGGAAAQAASAPRTAQRREQRSQPTAQRAAPALPGEGEKRKQQRQMHALFNELGLPDRDERLKYTSDVVGRELESSNDLTDDERATVVAALQRWRKQQEGDD